MLEKRGEKVKNKTDVILNFGFLELQRLQHYARVEQALRYIIRAVLDLLRKSYPYGKRY